jgi:hypothetical protein
VLFAPAKGAWVLATAGSHKIELLRGLGVAEAIVHTTTRFEDVAHKPPTTDVLIRRRWFVGGRQPDIPCEYFCTTWYRIVCVYAYVAEATKDWAMIDFSAVFSGQKRIGDLAADVTFVDLRSATDAQIDEMLNQIRDLSDDQAVFVAADPEAEGGIGWNVAHLIAHVTASSEENAAISSILARGIDYPFEPRLRFETDWTTLTTTAACIQRLEESRRIRQSYLSAWPDEPHLDTHRALPEGFAERVGPMNAVGSCLLGLVHEAGQFAQLREIIRQAQAVTA